MKHSSLPWEFDLRFGNVDDASGHAVAHDMSDADGVFLVRCVNNHYTMLAALKIAASVMETFEVGVDPEIRMAIAMAEGQ